MGPGNRDLRGMGMTVSTAHASLAGASIQVTAAEEAHYLGNHSTVLRASHDPAGCVCVRAQ